MYICWVLVGLLFTRHSENMISIKDKIAKMIALANGELVCHRHAVEAGLFVEDKNTSHLITKKKRKVNQDNQSLESR